MPLLSVAFPAYAFAVAHATGWWGVCYISSLYVAALASTGLVLSGVTLGEYYSVYYAL